MSAVAPLVARRAVLEHARRPLNMVLLVAVPVVLVFVWGGTLADFSELIGGTASRVQVEAATAGWAAAALAGLGGYFQVAGSRAADRRLAAAAGRVGPIVAGRVAASMTLAGLASAGGLIALAARTGIDDPMRAVAGTALVAVIYVALGALVGSVVRSEMNGALLVTLAWILDVFLGPALSGGSSVLTRVFPLHFPTLVLTSQASGHGGSVGDLGWALAWAGGLSILAVLRLLRAARPAPVAPMRSGAPSPADPRPAPPAAHADAAPATAGATAREVRAPGRAARTPLGAVLRAGPR
jgi:hypothetical protein